VLAKHRLAVRLNFAEGRRLESACAFQAEAEAAYPAEEVEDG